MALKAEWMHHVRIPQEASRISAYTLYFFKLESRAYILPLIVWVYLRLNFSGGLYKTFILQEWRFGFRPFKVIKGHWFFIESAYATSC